MDNFISVAYPCIHLLPGRMEAKARGERMKIVHRKVHVHACAHQTHAFPNMETISVTAPPHVQHDDKVGRATETHIIYVGLHPSFMWKEDGDGILKRVMQALGHGLGHRIDMNINPPSSPSSGVSDLLLSLHPYLLPPPSSLLFLLLFLYI